jgi:hypothetical protein
LADIKVVLRNGRIVSKSNLPFKIILPTNPGNKIQPGEGVENNLK